VEARRFYVDEATRQMASARSRTRATIATKSACAGGAAPDQTVDAVPVGEELAGLGS
jgi:hypothetical protein